MDFLRTPDERFKELTGYPYQPRYVEIGDGMRMHYVAAGPKDGPVILMLHGEPSWSYLYRHMIPIFAEAGYRAIAPDLIGFGRSDKPVHRDDYTYASHVAWTEAFIVGLDLKDITLVCQDWGGLIGLRLLATHSDRFARVIAANTFLPTGREPVSDAFRAWQKFSQETPELQVGNIINGATTTELSAATIAAYNAPFPDETYKAGARQFPALVPTEVDDPGAIANREAWKTLMTLKVPFLTAFSDGDPITRGADLLLQATIPGCKGRNHQTIVGAGHFLQEDRGPELALAVLDFAADTRTTK